MSFQLANVTFFASETEAIIFSCRTNKDQDAETILFCFFGHLPFAKKAPKSSENPQLHLYFCQLADLLLLQAEIRGESGINHLFIFH